MAEAFLDDLGMDPRFQREGRPRVSEVVEPYSRLTELFDAAGEVLGGGVGVQW